MKGEVDESARRRYALVPAFVARFLATSEELPPRQTPASVTIGPVMEKLQPPSH